MRTPTSTENNLSTSTELPNISRESITPQKFKQNIYSPAVFMNPSDYKGYTLEEHDNEGLKYEDLRQEFVRLKHLNNKKHIFSQGNLLSNFIEDK